MLQAKIKNYCRKLKAKANLGLTIAKAIGISLALLLITIALITLWYYFPILSLNVGIIIVGLLLLMPGLSGFYVGLKTGKNGMKRGALCGILLWLFLFVSLIVFAPFLLSLPLVGIGLLIYLFLGVAGGLCGVNINQIKAKQKTAPQE